MASGEGTDLLYKEREVGTDLLYGKRCEHILSSEQDDLVSFISLKIVLKPVL